MSEAEQIKKHRKRLTALEAERVSYEPHWKEARDYILPENGRFLDSKSPDKSDKGTKKRARIINNEASRTHEVATSGLISGFTSPSRPWFRLGMGDKDLMQYAPVKEWLTIARDRMLHVFAKSNFYGSTTSVYEELICFGVGAQIIDEDFKTVIRCRPLSIGEYFIALDHRYHPDTLYRRSHMTARQMIQRFGKDKVSHKVIENMAKGGEGEFSVIHCIQPRQEFDPSKQDPQNMRWESVYFEEAAGTGEEKFLRVSGYKGQPFMAPRWSGHVTHAYGNSPGKKALPDIKELQKIETSKLVGLDKAINPPLNVPMDMKQQGGPSVLPNGVNYVIAGASGQANGITPAYQVQLDMNAIREEVGSLENRIQRAFYNDIFLAIIQQDKQMTAREVSERSEEKLAMLGPILDRIQAEYLDVVVDRTFAIMLNNGLFPEVPEELQGQPLKTEYISVLAQAQKMVGISAIRDTIGLVSGLVELYPEARDKLNVDETIDEFTEMIGPPPRIVRSDEDANEIREGRAQQEAAQQQAMAGSAAVEDAQKLANTPLDGGNSNALEGILGGIL